MEYSGSRANTSGPVFPPISTIPNKQKSEPMARSFGEFLIAISKELIPQTVAKLKIYTW